MMMMMMMMSRGRVDVIVGLLLALVLALLLEASAAKTQENQQCLPSHCGSLNINYPFRLKGQPPTCGYPDLELTCQDNRATLSSFEGNYYVQHISYENRTIRLVDVGMDIRDYCSVPRNPFVFGPEVRRSKDTICFWSCTAHVYGPIFVNLSACSNSSSASHTPYFYAAFGIPPEDLPDSCNITLVYPITYSSDIDIDHYSISYIHQSLLLGFELRWCNISINYSCNGQSYDVKLTKRIFNRLASISYKISFFFMGRTSIGILCLIAIIVHRYQQRHLSIDDSIENFLQSHNNLKPIRYSFSEIKVMTKGFKDKLGQGGYGSVFKAKLRSGHLVAIKLLGKSSKANGQDFISEVATIGRIHHVNVVQLIGFCAEGSERALVYDFMSNGSLDKFIFSGGENRIPLSWERMYDIALGVARGIEYLHQGCDMRILHFDIKPHNILLDENFVPKVSDFGLAKLYSTNDSIVSLTAARGTLGYIAPELFYKNIGGISYKADVYSFGMMLIEMVGRRKNVNAFAEHSSQIYFPSWIHDQIYQGEDMELGDITEELKKLVRKMTIVALWCIQMKPVDRPSMSKVLDMLEGDTELLQMPPKPSFYPQDNPIEDHRASTSSCVDKSTSSQLSALST